MKKISLLACIFSLSILVNAQMIKFGELCPDITSRDVINYDKKEFRLSSYKGKLVIFDFWNHGCISCVRDFNRLDSLQKQFNDQIQIVLVCKEGRDSTLRFFAKRKKIKVPDLPLITNASAIWSSFTEDQSPFQSWIDTAGRLKYNTDPYNLTAGNINRYLQGKMLAIRNLSQEKRVATNEINSLGKMNPIFHSWLSKCDRNKPGRQTNFGSVLLGKGLRKHDTHSSILNLFLFAFEEGGRYQFISPAQVILDVSDSNRFKPPVNKELLNTWEKDHCYEYELILPAEKKDLRYKFMQQDLQRYFGLRARVEHRTIPALVLRRRPGPDRLKSQGGSPVDSLISSTSLRSIDESIRVFRNKPYTEFFVKLKTWVKYNNKLPVVDETGYEGKIDIILREVSIDPLNLEELRKDLYQYGLEIVEGDTCAEVLVLEEENSP